MYIYIFKLMRNISNSTDIKTWHLIWCVDLFQLNASLFFTYRFSRIVIGIWPKVELLIVRTFKETETFNGSTILRA